MKIGVIGAGTMGQGIAKAFAQVEGYTVALCDIKQEWADGGKAMFESLVSVCHASTRLCVASNITLPDESILTRTVAQWRGNPASIQKKNTVFLLLA